ncbi:MAG TPA: PAS domain S-box protein [Gallionella sp.]|nr:PAS domain S-box protein [Gallionella sp.]
MTIKTIFNSLTTRIIIVLLLIVILPTIAIGWMALNLMSEHIRMERIADVGRVADAKHEQLVMVLTRANDRAEHFLLDLSDQCGGHSAKLNHICATGLIRAYLAAEGAIGANIRRKGSGDSLTIGTAAAWNEENIAFQTGQLAKFSSIGPESNHSYFVSAAEKSTGLRLSITYPSSVLDPVFNPLPAALGLSGEAFLADGGGYFVTTPRYASTQGHSHPIYAHPMQACLSGQNREVLDLDYRDAETIHGFRFIPEFGSACIMAHVDQNEAFAPLNSLRRQLFFAIFLFGAILVIAVVYLAKSIVKPIAKLTEVTRAIATGDYQAQADTAGSDEISELASSFNFMTRRLRDSRDELHRLLNSMAEGMYGVDTDGNCTFVNQSFLKMLGYQNENEVLGKNMHELIHHSHADGSPHPISECKIYRAFQTNQATNAADEVFWRKDNTAIPVEYWSHPIVADGVVTGSIVTFADITERKRIEIELQEYQQLMRELAALTVASREAEHKHIAREVHDELGQLLTALRMDISLLRIQFGKHDPVMMEKIKEMLALADKAIQGVRNVAANLRPAALDMGVVPAIAWLCDNFSGHAATACTFQVVNDPVDLDDARTVAVFRIVQESLTNVARYAAANSVEITIGRHGEDVFVEVRDDGKGFDPAAISAKNSFGLMGMRERALAVGGKVEITSAPSKGTVVSVHIPIKPRENIYDSHVDR